MAAMVLVIAPKIGLADTVSDLQAQIAALLAHITKLQAQLQQLQGQPAAWCYTFTGSLKIGDGIGDAWKKEQDVANLQTALEKEGFDVDDSEQKGGAEFGESTASAVVGFQEKYRDEILTPNNLKRGTGFVGGSTKKKLNDLYGCKSSTCMLPEGCTGGGKICPIRVKPDVCVGGNDVVKYFDENGCVNYKCQDLVIIPPVEPPIRICPTFSPPSPEYCRDGILISGGTDSNGCQQPPKCKERESGNFCGGIAGVMCPSGYACKYDGNYPDAGGRCVQVDSIPTSTVYEQVKCVFGNSTTDQKCYTATDSTSSYYNYGCSTGGNNKEACVVDIKGKKGDQVTWKSSCGGYAYTLMDGQNEYAKFDCGVTTIQPSITVVSPNGGETWKIGETYKIETLSRIAARIYLQLFKNDTYVRTLGSLDSAPIAEVQGLGYMWTIPSDIAAGNDYKIRAIKIGPSGTNDQNVYDFSDASFSIVPAVVSGSANNGVCYMRSSGMPPSYADPDTGNGYAKTTISGVTSHAATKEKCTDAIFMDVMKRYCQNNTQSAQWEVAHNGTNGCAASGCVYHSCSELVQIQPVEKTCSGLRATNSSDFNSCSQRSFKSICFDKFTGVSQGCGVSSLSCTVNNTNAARNLACPTDSPDYSVNIISPNGGEVLKTNEQYLMTWNKSSSFPIGTQWILSLLKGGSELYKLSENATGTFLNWSASGAPATTGSDYRIRLKAIHNGETMASDDSDAIFSIVSPQTTAQPSLTVSASNFILAQNLLMNAPNQTLGGFIMNLWGGPLKISKMVFHLKKETSIDVGSLSDITNITLIDSNGTIVAGPVSAVAASNSSSEATITFLDPVTLPLCTGIPVGSCDYVLKGKPGSAMGAEQKFSVWTVPSEDWTGITNLNNPGGAYSLTNGTVNSSIMTVKASLPTN